MKYHSDNSTIEKAFNVTWYITASSFIVTFGLMIYGLYLAAEYKIDWLFLTSIFASIAIGGILTIVLCNYWFRFWISKVEDPGELYRRAIRLNMIFPSSAFKIVKKLNINVSNKSHNASPYLKLPDIAINKKVFLTNDSITVNNQTFDWQEIDNFGLEPYYTSEATFGGPTLDLVLHFKSDISIRFPLRVVKPSPFDFEYQVDRYLENSKKQNSKHT